MDLTGFRIALLAVCVAGFAAVAVGLVWRSVAPPEDVKKLAAERDLLQEKVRALEEDLRKKDLTLTLGGKGSDGALPRLPAAAGADADDPLNPPHESANAPGVSEGPLTPLPPASTEKQARTPKEDAGLGRSAALHNPSSPVESAPIAPPAVEPPGDLGVRPAPPSEPKEDTVPPMNFNALDITATRDTRGGSLSFRLVKDQPTVRFTGYLFIFVEMLDKKGETKLLAYPEGVKIGQEELPSDFRSGESITFKYNTRVELPYGDQRPGSALGRVSILLYGEDGAIVFQRSFDRTELKVVGAKPVPAKAEGAEKKPAKKRRAL